MLQAKADHGLRVQTRVRLKTVHGQPHSECAPVAGGLAPPPPQNYLLHPTTADTTWRPNWALAHATPRTHSVTRFVHMKFRSGHVGHTKGHTML